MTDGINGWSLGELFTVRIYKRLVGRPDRVWANTYELRANATGGTFGQNAELIAQDVMVLLANWERSFHLSSVQYDRALFSTYVPDGQPYNPQTFASRDLTGLLGQRDPNNSEPQPLQVCLLARKQVAVGRNGRNLYRGVLTEAQVTSPGGDPSLTAAARTELSQLVSGVGDFGETGILEQLNNAGVDLVMASGNTPGSGALARPVIGIAATGVVVKAYNNRYFDRS